MDCLKILINKEKEKEKVNCGVIKEKKCKALFFF